ncbi:MAG: PTS IIA-like nitrogen regulatory protein PtsN [Gammaproteobacteria bacterium]|nr:MAG: PTS IIA-like nitrogen regulatory protein PtsN [Gammaproteobacteria bacterium]
MSELQSVLELTTVHRFSDLVSKKKLFEKLAELLIVDSNLTFLRVLGNLNAREKLGSTYIGKGVAIPHCKIAVEAVKAVILILDEKIKYSESNQQQADIIFALLVPEENCDQHLHLLSSIARLCEDNNWLDGLRKLNSEKEITNYINKTKSNMAQSS